MKYGFRAKSVSQSVDCSDKDAGLKLDFMKTFTKIKLNKINESVY